MLTLIPAILIGWERSGIWSIAREWPAQMRHRRIAAASPFCFVPSIENSSVTEAYMAPVADSPQQEIQKKVFPVGRVGFGPSGWGNHSAGIQINWYLIVLTSTTHFPLGPAQSSNVWPAQKKGDIFRRFRKTDGSKRKLYHFLGHGLQSPFE